MSNARPGLRLRIARISPGNIRIHLGLVTGTNVLFPEVFGAAYRMTKHAEITTYRGSRQMSCVSCLILEI